MSLILASPLVLLLQISLWLIINPLNSSVVYSENSTSNSFDWNLFKAVAQKNLHYDVIISPFSTKLLLTLLAASAGNETIAEQEILSTVYPECQVKRYVFKYLENIFQQLNEKNSSKILLTNRIYADEGTEIRPKFPEILKAKYNAIIEKLDLVYDTEAVHTINSLISRQTNKTIQNFFDPDNFNNMMALYLNTVYLNGNWKQVHANQGPAFEKESNETESNEAESNEAKSNETESNETESNETEAKFTSTNPTSTTTTITGWHHNSASKSSNFPKILNHSGNTEYFYRNSSELSAEIVRLDFRCKNYAMYLILPHNSDDLNNLITKLNPNILRDEQRQMQMKKPLSVELPKIKYEYTAQLKEPLQNLGIKEIFSTNRKWKNFPTNYNDVPINLITQKAGIEFNENGTAIAYAATSGALCPNSVKKASTRINPFVFYIVHKKTNTIIFIGKITGKQPKKKSSPGLPNCKDLDWQWK